MSSKWDESTAGKWLLSEPTPVVAVRRALRSNNVAATPAQASSTPRKGRTGRKIGEKHKHTFEETVTFVAVPKLPKIEPPPPKPEEVPWAVPPTPHVATTSTPGPKMCNNSTQTRTQNRVVNVGTQTATTKPTLRDSECQTSPDIGCTVATQTEYEEEIENQSELIDEDTKAYLKTELESLKALNLSIVQYL
ncbi:protein ORF118 [Anguillid herpesvirus 1]|uniref:Protein ORF118 n=1 Tax=Anguillid herpesvirus 1 TaxID=150286 RepID=A0A1J0RF42_9VIRU|nr:protein ORF118 [Anguillid herpesvirus 1]ADA57881.1 protein ORF118 [Anguillid herpesvirus 1]APD76282.1 ORF118 [Anguillid herpesvirus 1]QRM16412.1 protein ORF118 [Anguillid herpesvirus 1]QRM16539.1 protein ORF118 [Anguillid herpesvirus 1]QRM16671.1 protein ORF118 [Anguillid herpesvirus 1]